jgi:dipeptidyl aminopeptidase/acylaminoacyl peptidase
MNTPLSPTTIAYDLTRIKEACISPDGEHIAYVRVLDDPTKDRLSRQLWSARRVDGEPRQLTSGPSATNPCWSPDGRYLAYVISEDDTTSIQCREVDREAPARSITAHRHGIGDLAWSSDGRWIAYTTRFDPDDPEETLDPNLPRPGVVRRFDYKLDERGFLYEVRNQVFVVEVDTGQRKRLSSGPSDHSGPSWSPDGRWLAARSVPLAYDRSQLALFSVAGNEPSRLVGPDEGTTALWAWSPDGGSIVVAGDAPPTYRFDDLQYDWFRYDLASNTYDRLTDDLTCWPNAGPVWLDDDRVLFAAVEAAVSGLYQLDTRSGEVRRLVGWEASHSGLAVDRAGRWAVQVRTDQTVLQEIVAVDLATYDIRQVTSHNQHQLSLTPIAKREPFSFERAGLTIESWLIKPPDFDPAKLYPVILYIHGGPNGFHDLSFDPNEQLLATNGFLVVSPNPRGSVSFGRDFAEQVLNDWGGEDFRDDLAALDEVLRQPYADSGRTGVCGYSYGGYMTSWIVGQTDRFRAAVTGAPVTDLVSFYGTSDAGIPLGMRMWGGPPHENRSWYIERSPITHAPKATTPTLILVGEDDHDCPVGQAEQFFVALHQAGCPVELVRYPGLGHAGLFYGEDPKLHADFLSRTLDWFKRYLDVSETSPAKGEGWIDGVEH